MKYSFNVILMTLSSGVVVLTLVKLKRKFVNFENKIDNLRFYDYICTVILTSLFWYKMEENVATRLKLFFEYRRLTNSQFADQCGIPRPSLSQLLTGRNRKISDVFVRQIHSAFPELSVMWLLFGEGAMIDESVAHSAKEGSPVNDISVFTSEGTDSFENFRETGLDGGHIANQYHDNKEFRSSADRVSEIDKIDFQSVQKRKVTHITVYYEDSTFETFYPR